MRSPFAYHRRTSRNVATIGHDHVPRVVAHLADASITRMEDLAAIGHVYDAATDKWAMRDQAAEFLYMGRAPLPFMAPTGTRQFLDADVWSAHDDKLYCVPVFSLDAYLQTSSRHSVMNVVRCTIDELTDTAVSHLSADTSVVLLLSSTAPSYYTSMRAAIDRITEAGLTAPILLEHDIRSTSLDTCVLYASTDLGGLLVDGLGDGTMLRVGTPEHVDLEQAIRLSFTILQATRTRMTKTEYISCPSCGRTLFDLQETTARIRSHTDHLKGVKIGIMGCIVNGPGEMADADYGYVGSGPDRITLYRGQDIVQRNIPSDGAVEALIEIIKSDDRWVEPASSAS